MAAVAVTVTKVGAIYPQAAEIFDAIALEAVTAGAPLYIDPTTGKVGLADANAAGKQQFRGLALSAAAAGQAVSVLKKGHVGGFTLSGNYDSAVYLSDTVGTLDTSAGTMTVNVGRVVAMPDASLTKVLYVEADWLRAWS